MMAVAPSLDAKVMAEIHRQSFEEPWSALFMGALLGQPGVVALVSPAENPSGFVMVRIAADEAEILTVAVAPDHRRRRVGQQLMSAALKLMAENNVARCFLEVAADNTAAKALYANLGFVRCGVRPKYYGTGPIQTDAVIMEKIITKS